MKRPFKIGEIVEFNPHAPKAYSAQKGALGIVRGYNDDSAIIKWIKQANGQMNGLYFIRDFKKIIYKNKTLKYINKFAEKTYKDPKKWAEDMLKGLKQDLEAYKKQEVEGQESGNINDLCEGRFVGQFIEWFIDNHFKQKGE